MGLNPFQKCQRSRSHGMKVSKCLSIPMWKGRGGGKGEKGKGWRREGGKGTEGMGGTGEKRTWDGTRREGKWKGEMGRKGRSGATAPKLQFLAPPLPNTTVDGVDVVVCDEMSGLSQSHNGLQT